MGAWNCQPAPNKILLIWTVRELSIEGLILRDQDWVYEAQSQSGNNLITPCVQYSTVHFSRVEYSTVQYSKVALFSPSLLTS